VNCQLFCFGQIDRVELRWREHNAFLTVIEYSTFSNAYNAVTGIESGALMIATPTWLISGASRASKKLFQSPIVLKSTLLLSRDTFEWC
jgi:hypothetical protein